MKFSWHTFFIKLTSRKLWVSIAGLVAAVMAYLNCNDNTTVQVSAIIMALGSVVGYLIANGLTDSTGTESVSDAETSDATGQSTDEK